MSAATGETVSRAVGGTELSLCRALPGGTGITVLALLLSKPPDLQILQTALHKIQNAHPILRSQLRYDPTARSFSFVTPPASTLQVKSFDLRSTLKILHGSTESLSPFQKLAEHELNLNPWRETNPGSPVDLFEAKLYELEGGRWAVALKAHTAACDRVAGDAVLAEVVRAMSSAGGAELGIRGKGEVKMGIEEYGWSGKAKKSLWSRGVNMLGYSLKAFRQANIDYVDTRSPRRTQLVRLRLEPDVTTKLLQGCRNREMKLCGALTASALIAARRCSKRALEGQLEKYTVATLVDCRSLLEPPLNSHDVGFYHSAILNTHDINGRERFWEMAQTAYESFKAAKSGNKHLRDMADLNFLMCKAIENPGLTPSSAQRTSFITVFEDEALQHHADDKAHKDMSVEDYVVSSSVHGVGPTVAIFNSVRDGGLDCWCAYPGPLHSRQQMQALLDQIKTILMEATY